MLHFVWNEHFFAAILRCLGYATDFGRWSILVREWGETMVDVWCREGGVGWLWISIESWGRWCLAVKGVNSLSYSNIRWCDKSQLPNKFQWIRVCHIGSSWRVFGCDKIENLSRLLRNHLPDFPGHAVCSHNEPGAKSVGEIANQDAVDKQMSSHKLVW